MFLSKPLEVEVLRSGFITMKQESLQEGTRAVIKGSVWLLEVVTAVISHSRGSSVMLWPVYALPHLLFLTLTIYGPSSNSRRCVCLRSRAPFQVAKSQKEAHLQFGVPTELIAVPIPAVLFTKNSQEIASIKHFYLRKQ